MSFRVKLLCHSVNPVGDAAITFETCHERFIHAEVMTHRWSRNASSSRAIPYERMKEWILEDPAMPLHLGTNKPGMQSGCEIDDKKLAIDHIRWMLDMVVGHSDRLVEDYDLHKEIVNRYLEPWGWINFVMTTSRSQLMNFFKLRIDGQAHPNIQRLAVQMARLYRESVPTRLEEGEWHLPYVDRSDVKYAKYNLFERLVWSTAHCAWVSYQTADGKVATYEKAKNRHDACVKLKHCTPLEHQLRARNDHGRNGGCVAGFDCYRHMIPDESASDFDFSILDTVYADRDYWVGEWPKV